MAAQVKKAQRVGIIRLRAVYFKLPVSFFTVKRVLLQGQCRTENSITFMAVRCVQPFETSRSLTKDRSLTGSSVPFERYAMIIMGKTGNIQQMLLTLLIVLVIFSIIGCVLKEFLDYTVALIFVS